MSPGRRRLVILLIVLAASPLTVPFATCDVLELFGEESPVSATALKPPKIDDPVVALAAAGQECADAPAVAAAPRAPSRRSCPRSDVSLPLRL